MSLISSLCLASGAAILYWRRLRPSERFSHSETAIVLVLSVLFSLYALSWYWSQVPSDYWLDFPQTSLLAREGLPNFHPYFPDLKLGGHYGRSLLVAILQRFSSLSVITVFIVSNVVLQGMLFLQCVLLGRRLTGRFLGGILCGLIVFLGLCVGGWCGLLDHFFHHASLAHFLLFFGWLQWHENKWWFGLPALALALVFPIYLCLLLPTLVLFQAIDRKVVGFFACLLVVALLQGGPLSQLVSQGNRVKDSSATQEQSFQVKFPKRPAFTLSLEPWHYWRVSRGLKLLRVPGSDNVFYGRTPSSIFSIEVLRLHWIPLWLAPLTLFLAKGEERQWWLFGCLSFLVPSLVDFGEVYNADYYRWQLGAAVGFGVTLAAVCSRIRGAWILVLLACLPGVIQMGSLPWRIDWPSAQVWFEHHARELRLRDGEYDLSIALRSFSSPGDLVWRDTSFDFDDHRAILPEATVAGLAGLKITGHAYPLPTDFVSRPPFRRSLNFRTFWETGSNAPLMGEGVDWIIAESWRDLNPVAEPVLSKGILTLWRIRGKPSLERPVVRVVPESLVFYPGEVRRLASEEASARSKEGGPHKTFWRSKGQKTPWRSQAVYSWSPIPATLVAPDLVGDFDVILDDGRVWQAEVLPQVTVDDLVVQESIRSQGGMKLKLKNSSGSSLRLHNVYLRLAGSEIMFHEVFVINAGAEIPLEFSIPNQGREIQTLELESEEGNRIFTIP